LEGFFEQMEKKGSADRGEKREKEEKIPEIFLPGYRATYLGEDRSSFRCKTPQNWAEMKNWR